MITLDSLSSKHGRNPLHERGIMRFLEFSEILNSVTDAIVICYTRHLIPLPFTLLVGILMPRSFTRGRTK